MTRRWEDRYVRVQIEGGHQYFFERFLDAVDVRALTIVSPWITGQGQFSDIFAATLRKVATDRIRLTAVMRHPDKEWMNSRAISLLAALPTATVYTNNELHAKLYVCRCTPFGFAYVGSANLTGRGTTAFEVGLLVEGKGEGAPIVEELERVGNEDLPNRSGTRLYHPELEPY